MGLAEAVPGVSGSTLALAMGIYERFIDFLHQISNFGKDVLKKGFYAKNWSDRRPKILGLYLRDAAKKVDWGFGIMLFIGMLISIALFSSALDYLTENYNAELYAVFFGLVVASITVPYSEIKKLNLKIFLYIIASAVLTFLILGVKGSEPLENPSVLLLFFGGIVGVSGLLLPGVSGSFILLMLGIYEYVLGSVKEIIHLEITGEKIIGIFVFIIGLIFGFVFFVRLLKFLLANYKDALMAVLIGIMIGSLRVISPFSIQTETNIAILFLLIAAGFLFVSGLKKIK